MPIRLRCLNGHSLEVEDRFAGSFMECPMCGCDVQVGAAPPLPPVATLVTAPEALPLAARPPGQEPPPVAALVAIPAPLPPPPPARPRAAEEIPELSVEDDEDEPGKKRRPRRKPAPRREPVSEKMRRVSLGLTFFCVKFVLLVVALFLHAIAAACTGLSKIEGLSTLFTVLYVLVLVAEIGFGLVGAILCCFVPRKLVLRPLAITTAALEGGSVLLTLFGVILAVSNTFAGIVLVLIGTVADLGAWVTFMVFLSNLSGYLDDETTAAEVMHMMVVLSSVWGGALLLSGCFAAGMKDSSNAFPIFRVFLSLALIGVQLKFMEVMLKGIGRLRQQITSRWYS